MVDMPGLNPIPKNLREKYGGIVSLEPAPFDMGICGFLTWATAIAGATGAVAALAWALSANDGRVFLSESSFQDSNEFRNSPGFEFSDREFQFGGSESISPGLR